MRKLQQRPHSDLSDWILIGAIALMTGAVVWVPVLAARL
jgi:hypothetical protein